ERGDQLGGLLDGLGAVVVGADLPGTAAAATPGAQHCGTSLTQRRRDAATGPAGGSGDHRDPPSKRRTTRGPPHPASLPFAGVTCAASARARGPVVLGWPG